MLLPTPRSTFRLLFLFAAVSAALVLSGFELASPAFAQLNKGRRKKTEVDPGPLVVVNVASVERLLKEADFTFESVGRPELSESLNGLLANVGDLKGLNRDQSVGVMIFLNGIIPEAVGFVPVKNLADLVKTVEGGPVTTKKIEENRYEIVGRRQTLHARIEGDYAFIGNSAEAVDRDFSDPVKLTSRLSAAYDIAASINLRTLPEATRELFLSFLRTQTEIDLQRRDNEPEPAHRVRKAFGMRNLAEIEMLLKEGEELTLGWNVSAEERNASLEIVVGAVPGSDLAGYLNEMHAARSHFVNLLRDRTPLTASLSVKLTKATRKLVSEAIAAAEMQMTADLAKAGGNQVGDANPIADFFKVLKTTAETGHIDAAVQFIGEPPGPFTLLGGVRVTDGETLAASLADIVGRLKGNADFSSIKLNAATHRGIALHRIESARVNSGEEKLYGTKPAVYCGAGAGTFWFAVGGDGAVASLKKAMDNVAKPADEKVATVPMQFVANISSWMHLIDGDANPSPTAGIARSAFSKGGDSLRAELKPLENGARFRVQFDEGFIRFVGQQLDRRFDRR